MGDRLTIFVSHSPKDAVLKDALLNQLAILERLEQVEVWKEERILAGARFQLELTRAIDGADMVILLLSGSWLKLLLNDVDLQESLVRRIKNRRGLIPVVLRPCNWNAVPLLKDLQSLPRDGKPLAREEDQEEATRILAAELAAALGQLAKTRRLRQMAITVGGIAFIAAVGLTALKPSLPYVITTVGLAALGVIGVIAYAAAQIRRVSMAASALVTGATVAGTALSASALSVMLATGFGAALITVVGVIGGVTTGIAVGEGLAAAKKRIETRSGSVQSGQPQPSPPPPPASEPTNPASTVDSGAADRNVAVNEADAGVLDSGDGKDGGIAKQYGSEQDVTIMGGRCKPFGAVCSTRWECCSDICFGDKCIPCKSDEMCKQINKYLYCENGNCEIPIFEPER